MGQAETGELGVPVNTTVSLKVGPRGPVLLEDTIGRKKVLHFAKERQAERVVHAVGHGAYGTFVSNGDHSNLTSACFLQAGASSDTFVRFSTVISPAGGGDVDRDIRGFATKLYTQCGNHDLLGLHLPSFLVNDGLLFPDVVHAIKQEPNTGFPACTPSYPWRGSRISTNVTNSWYCPYDGLRLLHPAYRKRVPSHECAKRPWNS